MPQTLDDWFALIGKFIEDPELRALQKEYGLSAKGPRLASGYGHEYIAQVGVCLYLRGAARDGKPLRHLHTWAPYRRISQNLKRAVLVAEDDAFFEHEGVDLEQLRKSIELDIKQGKAVRGGSTVTQQLAKNLYLSPTRDPLRKLRELIIARRLETALSKARIFELYLNLIEWGDGVWGAEAAARTYFHTSAASLSRA